MKYNLIMKKKTRKAIVVSIVYLIITWIISSILSNLGGFSPDDWLGLWLISSIPVAFYWAKKFIAAGED